MTPFQVQINAQAAEDLIEIWAEIAVHNPVAADEYLRRLEERIANLVHMPERGVTRGELMTGLRMLVEGNYLVFYRVKDAEVEVLRVLHGSRDIPRLFS